PARINSGPSPEVTASRCCSLSEERKSISGELANAEIDVICNNPTRYSELAPKRAGFRPERTIPPDSRSPLLLHQSLSVNQDQPFCRQEWTDRVCPLATMPRSLCY